MKDIYFQDKTHTKNPQKTAYLECQLKGVSIKDSIKSISSMENMTSMQKHCEPDMSSFLFITQQTPTRSSFFNPWKAVQHKQTKTSLSRSNEATAEE